MHNETSLAPGDRIAGRYRIERHAGGGASGHVYKGQDERTSRTVAIKVLDPALRTDEELSRRFFHEAKIVGGLRDPRIVRLFDLITLQDGRPGIVLEWVQGRTLADRLAAGPITLAEAIELTYEILTGLSACHAVGVVHGDVKPENVMLPTHRQPSAPRVKLIDFGFARSVAGAADAALAGSPSYMAPELWLNEHIDARTDLYAVGLLAYTLFYGRPLMKPMPSAAEMCAQHLNRARPEFIITNTGEAVPPILVAALRRATAAQRTDRHPDLLALRDALREADERFQQSSGEATQPTSPGVRPQFSFPPAPVEHGLTDWLADSDPPEHTPAGPATASRPEDTETDHTPIDDEDTAVS